MAKHSKIEWCDHTFNPWTGCTKVSPACDNCYAEAWSKRSGHVEWGPHGDRRRTKTWGDPVKWNKRLEGTGRRERVFCASLADVFDNHRSIDPAWRDDLWELIRLTPNLIWLLLTKRPQNIERFLPKGRTEVFPNVWLGTTVENQDEARRRLPFLCQIPAPVHFISAEPLLGPLDLGQWLRPVGDRFGVNWVIAGGESGSGARPMHPEWARDLRDQCQAARVPFHFKQWGDWAPGENVPPEKLSGRCADATWFGGEWVFDHTRMNEPEDKWHEPADLYRIGKKHSGRLLDGREWNEVPA